MLSKKKLSQHGIQLAFKCLLNYLGHVVVQFVEAPRYKLEGRSFNS